MHQRAAGPHRHFPERQIYAFGGKGFMNEIVFADRCAARGDENIRRKVAGLPNGGDGRFERVGHQAEIADDGALPARQRGQRKAVRIDNLPRPWLSAGRH